MAQVLSTGHKTVTRYHQDDGKFHIQTTADVQAVVDHAAHLRNTRQHTNPMGDKHLGRIHIVHLNAWANRHGIQFDDIMKDNRLLMRYLEDPENAAFIVCKD